MNYIKDLDLESIPILYKDVTLFSKETEDGGVIFIPKKIPQMESMKMNQTSSFIIDNIRKNKTIYEILKELIKKYPEIDVDKIKIDLIDFIKELTDMKFLYWNENTFIEATKKNFGEYTLILDDIESIKDNIDIKNIKSDDLLIKKIDLSTQRLEILTLLKKEVFFSLRRGEEYILVLRISNRFSGIWIQISYINNIFDITENIHILKESIKYASEFYRNEYERKYGINFGNKITTYFTDYDDLHLYYSVGFSLEGVIEQAISSYDQLKKLYIMGCFL